MSVMPQPGPEPGQFDWLLKGASVQSEFDIPVAADVMPGADRKLGTLRVVITAKATVVPGRGWGTFIVLAVVVIASLLVEIAISTAHGAEPGRWSTWENRQVGQDWGALQPGRTTTYAPLQGPGGRQGRCGFYQWRGETRATCD